MALARDPALLAAAMAPYRCVIVDEFQDINRLDFELIRLLARDRQLVVVGDDDQAIYGFRGCSPDYIIDFAANVGRGVETHVLRTNYRCPRNLVAMAARLIGHNTRRVPKESLPGRADEADVRVWHCVNAGSEAQILARFIRRLHAEHAGRGFRFADVAILTRMNSQSLPLQIALILEGIPYHCRREENVLLSETMGQLLGLIGLHLRLRAAPGYHAPGATRLICRCFFRYQPPEAVEAFDRLVMERGGYPAATRWADRALEFRPPVAAHDLARAVAALASEATPALLVERIGASFKYLGGLVGSLDEALDNAPAAGGAGRHRRPVPGGRRAVPLAAGRAAGAGPGGAVRGTGRGGRRGQPADVLPGQGPAMAHGAGAGGQPEGDPARAGGPGGRAAAVLRGDDAGDGQPGVLVRAAGGAVEGRAQPVPGRAGPGRG